VRGFTHVVVQPNSGRRPISLHGGGGNTEHVGGLLDGKSAEKPHFYNSALLRIEFGELCKASSSATKSRLLLLNLTE